MRTSIQNKVMLNKKFNAFLILFSLAFFLVFQPTWVRYQSYIMPASATDLADFFEDVAFGSDFGGEYPFVAKWYDYLHIAIEEQPDTFNQEDLNTVIDKLSKLTGVKISITPVLNGNLFLHFIEHNDLPSRLEIYAPDRIQKFAKPQNLFCSAEYRYNVEGGRAYQIENSFVLISMDIPQMSFYQAFIEKIVSGSPYKWKHSCLRQELMQVLGLAKDSDIVSPSVINDFENHEAYSANDMIIIRTLYDPRIQAGMHKDEVMPLVRNVIIPELIAAYEKGGEEALYQ